MEDATDRAVATDKVGFGEDVAEGDVDALE